MARTDTSRWTSEFIVKVAIAAAAIGCLGPLTFAVVRSGTDEPERTRQVATVGQVSLNSSPAASQAQTPAARSSESATVGTTIPGAAPATSTTVLVPLPSTTSTTAAVRGAPSQVAVVTVVDADDGKTIVLRRDQTLRVVLEGPTWQFAEPSDPKVLAPQGEPTYTQGENCAALPGTNCGKVTAEFRALKTGAATVTATRAPCGEPFRCVNEEAKYQLGVTVRT